MIVGIGFFTDGFVSGDEPSAGSSGSSMARMSGLGSSEIESSPLERASLVSLGEEGRKSATAAAITATSASTPVTASSISRAVSTDTTLTLGSTGRVDVVTSVTARPRRAASLAMAWPIFPDERLPR